MKSVSAPDTVWRKYLSLDTVWCNTDMKMQSPSSGHTADAALMLCLSFVALTKKKYEKDKAMFYSGCAFAAVVAFSRIIMGAHFLSDVTFGFGNTFVLYLVFRRIFYGPTQRDPREELGSSQSI